MGRGNIRSISLTFGVFFGACSVSPQVFAVTSVFETFMKSTFAGVCVTDEEAD